MIRQIRNCTKCKFLFGLLGLYLLNISVDTEDPYPNYIAEDLTFNDQESIVELVLEQLLGFENAIKEYDDCDTQNNKVKTSIKIDFVSQHKLNSIISCYQDIQSKIKLPKLHFHLAKGFQNIDIPPPKI